MMWTHGVGLEARGGRARGPGRGGGAPARPPTREYHRAPRITAGAGALRLHLSHGAHADSRAAAARTRVFINGIPSALFAAGYNFLHDFRHLRRPEHWRGGLRAPASWIVCGVRVTHAPPAPSRLNNLKHKILQPNNTRTILRINDKECIFRRPEYLLLEEFNYCWIHWTRNIFITCLQR